LIKNLIDVINIIKINTNANKRYTYVSSNKNIKILLSKLLDLNIIEGTQQLSPLNIKVFLRKKNNFVKNIKILYKISNKYSVNLKSLEKMNKTKFCIYVLFTNKGMLTSIEAERLGIGGVLFFKL
jgi:ribosomal protein S8